MPIVFHCGKCSRRYRVDDNDAGRLGECRTCGHRFEVPRPQPVEPDLPILSPPEQPIASEAEQSSALISQHVERYLGPITQVIRQPDSMRRPIDILHIAPNEVLDCHTLVTCGMSGRRMNVPLDLEHADLEFAELMMCLPANWKFDQIMHHDDRRFWPVQLLQELSHLPDRHRTWLGPGHTVPNGDPAQPYAEGVRFSCALVVPPINVAEGFDRAYLSQQSLVRFYGVVPLFPEETEFKLRHGVEPLLQRFDQYFISKLLEPSRRNVCRRWWSVL